MNENNKRHYVPPKQNKVVKFKKRKQKEFDGSLDSCELDADDAITEGFTFGGQTVKEWLEERDQKRKKANKVIVSAEARVEHEVKVVELSKFARKTRSGPKAKMAPQTEFSGFVKTYTPDEVEAENAKRRFGENMENKIVLTKTVRGDKNAPDVDGTILNLMMCWKTDVIKPVLAGLLELKLIDDTIMSAKNIVAVMEKMAPNEAFKKKFKNKTVGPRLSRIYKGLGPKGLIVRKETAKKSGRRSILEYSLSPKIFKMDLDRMKATVKKADNKVARDGLAKRTLKKKQEADKELQRQNAGAGTGETAPDSSEADIQAKYDLNTEDGLKKCIIEVSEMNDEESELLVATNYELVKAIMTAGYKMAVSESGKDTPALEKEAGSESLDEAGSIMDVDETDIDTDTDKTLKTMSTNVDDLIKIVSAAPRGCKISKSPDGTIEVCT